MKNGFTILLLFCFWITTAQVTIIVDAIPSNTPVNDPLYIAGSMNGWDPAASLYQFLFDNTLQRHHLTLSGSGNIQFKFTRGTWGKVEGTANGGFVPNRTYSFTGGTDTIYLQIAGWEDLAGSGGSQSTAASNVSILTDSFYIPQLNRYRRVWVYVPPNYATSGLHYPVLYMHDGQNVFDVSTSFSGEWSVDETLNDLYNNGDTGIIVVAIDNGGNQRLNEYSPWVNPNYGGGQGAMYVDFLVNTLKPHIDSVYRTLPDRNNTGILGSSMGGLISLYAGLAHQDVFGKVGSFSPAYWFSNQTFAQPGAVGKQHPMKVYQIIGTLEGSTYVNGMWRMQDSLLQHGFLASEVRSLEFQDGQHSEWFWKREFKDAYLWLFRDFATTTTPIASENEIEWRIYPNPMQDSVQIEVDFVKKGKYKLAVFDSKGTLIEYIEKGNNRTGQHTATFQWKPRQALSSGIYYLYLTMNGNRQMKKILKWK